ncbi:MAG: glycosyltransferase family 2 protein [Magnetococcales bacterium]|nr:glycosyltransferase family 2 protein [Magnetococcales bacterium]
MKVIVIIPAFNEGEIIARTVTALAEMKPLFREAGRELRVYVVDDGSRDDTRQQAEAAGADRVLRHRVNRGLGAAVRTGLNGARADGAAIAIKFDADLQHDPHDLPALIQPLLDDEADVVYGQRFDRIEYRMPLIRRWGNRVFTGLVSWLTGWPVKDGQPGIFAVNRSYLEVFYLPGDYNYTQQVLVDAYRKGMRFAHVPVSFRRRTTGRSFISLKYPVKVLPQIFMVLVAVRPLKIFGPLGLLFLVAGLGLFCWEFMQWLLEESAKPIRHVNLVLGLFLFGIQTLFFGVLAHLIVEFKGRDQG